MTEQLPLLAAALADPRAKALAPRCLPAVLAEALQALDDEEVLVRAAAWRSVLRVAEVHFDYNIKFLFQFSS